MIKRLCILIVLSGMMAVPPALAKPFQGPFVLNDGLTFYLVNPTGASFDLSLKYTNPWRKDAPRPLLIRVFDPDEQACVRYESDGQKTPQPGEEEFKTRIEGTKPGIYQIVMHGGMAAPWAQTTVSLKTEPEMEFGVFGHLQWLTGLKDQFADSYVYLPPGLRRLPVEAADTLDRLVMLDEAGQTKLELGKERKKGEIALPAGEHVWRLQASGAYYRLDFKGYPIILCPSEATARAIRASVDVMPDGSICFHKHQVEAWKLLQGYKRRPASDYAVKVVPLEQVADKLMKEPNRNQLLFGSYGVMPSLPAVLAEQNLDPKSPWFGSIWKWKDKEGKSRAGNPLADYDRAGEEAYAALNKNLAALYWMKGDFNPYYQNPQLLNRIIIGALLDQMVMKEGEFCNVSNTSYWGIHAFTFEHAQSGAFSLVWRKAPEEVRRVWQAGQQRLTDRFLYGTVGGCTNQWTILLTGLWRYYEGTKDEAYRTAILRNAHWLTECTYGGGQRPAGYMTEANGPDATYNGITGHSLSELYHHSGDAEVLEAQRKSYNLFNHTIAPEPNGTWLGSSGYCHRTPGDWVSPQYGAGLGPMSDNLTEAGLRYPGHGTWAYAEPFTDEKGRKEAEEQLAKVLKYYGADWFALEPANYGRALGAFDISFANWRIFENKYLPGKLPCVAEERFARNFGDEFLCVRRPKYYAFLYGGVSYQQWQVGSRPQDYTEQYPHNDGLCIFWSPEFGSSLLTKNWGAARANTLLVKMGEGRVLWPWYLDVKSRLDAEQGSATLTGTIHDTPLSYERAYRFLDDGIECILTVKAATDFRCESVAECIPYPLEDLKPGMKVTLADAAGKEVLSGGAAREIRFRNAEGNGHTVALAEPRMVELGQEESVDHYGGKHVYGRALVQLPRDWKSGETVVVRYLWMAGKMD